jgi:curli biogenesis system outer membrane secretion channel CsgG
MKETFMRIMALVLAGALAVCFMNPASAATKRSASVANPDRSIYPNSRGCSTYCYRSGKQKIQKQKHNH